MTRDAEPIHDADVRKGRPDPAIQPDGTPADHRVAADQRALWAMIDGAADGGHDAGGGRDPCPHDCHVHRPVATVADSGFVHAAIPGLHTRNLFLTDRRDALWLVTVPDTAAVDLSALGRMLAADRGGGRAATGAGRRLSFAAPDVLWAACRLTPGSVTPLGVIADVAGRVRLVIDTALAIAPVVCVHPLRNDATLSLPGPRHVDLVRRMGHAPLVASLPRRTVPADRPATEEE